MIVSVRTIRADCRLCRFCAPNAEALLPEVAESAPFQVGPRRASPIAP
jgi:hypothetical protein